LRKLFRFSYILKTSSFLGFVSFSQIQIRKPRNDDAQNEKNEARPKIKSTDVPNIVGPSDALLGITHRQCQQGTEIFLSRRCHRNQEKRDALFLELRRSKCGFSEASSFDL